MSKNKDFKKVTLTPSTLGSIAQTTHAQKLDQPRGVGSRRDLLTNNLGTVGHLKKIGNYLSKS